MSWLERWDRRNERILRWHEHEDAQEDDHWRGAEWSVLLVGFGVANVLTYVISAAAGEDYVGVFWVVIAVAGFASLLWNARSRRKAFEHEHGRQRRAGHDASHASRTPKD